MTKNKPILLGKSSAMAGNDDIPGPSKDALKTVQGGPLTWQRR